MKNNFFMAISLSILLSTGALAQIETGLKAGPILSNISSESLSLGSSDFSEPKLSYMIGGFVALSLGEKINLQAELLYLNKGYKSDKAKSRFNVHYLTLPMLLQYKLIDRFKVELGPEVSYQLSAYSKNIESKFTYSWDYIKPFDFGIDLGIQYNLSEKLILAFRYNLGMFDISEDVVASDIEGNPVVIKSKSYNRSLQCSIGYRIF